MLEEVAVVKEVHHKHILVSSSRLNGCNACQAKSNCGQRSLAGLFGRKDVLIRLENPDNLIAKPGQSVILGLHEQALLVSSLVMYLLPLLIMIIVAVLTHLAHYSEGMVILSGLLGLALGFLISRKLSVKLLSKPDYYPILLSIQDS